MALLLQNPRLFPEDVIMLFDILDCDLAASVWQDQRKEPWLPVSQLQLIWYESGHWWNVGFWFSRRSQNMNAKCCNERDSTSSLYTHQSKKVLSYSTTGQETQQRLSGQTSLKKSISNVQLCSFLIKAYKDVHYTISIPFATMQCRTLYLFSPFMPGSDFRSIYLARNNWTASCVAIGMHISDWTLLGQFSGYCSTCQDL